MARIPEDEVERLKGEVSLTLGAAPGLSGLRPHNFCVMQNARADLRPA